MHLLLLTACESSTGLNRVKSPPFLWIDEPAQGAEVRQSDTPIGLAGRVEDEVDKPSEIALRWILDQDTDQEVEYEATTDADGNVTGEVPGDISLGEHRLVLEGVDQDGELGQAVGVFTVLGPMGAPTVDIYAPDDGYTSDIGLDITFRGNATDVTTPIDQLAFAWASDVDGPLLGAVSGSGESILITSQLTEGTHTITLSVTDTDGEVGTDQITVNISGEPEPPQPGDLIFSEFMVNPSVVADEDGEWVELYNTSGYTLDIAGYSFHDDASDEWVFDASVLVGPGEYMVLCANMNPNKNGGVPCDGWFYRQPLGEEPTGGLGHGSGVAIANNDDEMVLTSPDGVDIDIFDYNDTDSDSIETAMSFGLDPGQMDGVSNDRIMNWCVQRTILSGMTEPGTPGAENDSCN